MKIGCENFGAKRMVCRTEFESEDGLVAFMAEASEKDASEALNELRGIAQRTPSKKNKARLERLFDDASALYEKKFNQVWMPF